MTSPQYKMILNNKGTIIYRSIEIDTRSQRGACNQVQEEEWLSITEKPTEERLVNTVLGRIKRNPANLNTFIDMLNDVTGLDQIVETLEAPSPTDRTSRQSTDKASRQSSQGRVDLGTIISKKQLDKIAGELLTDWEELSPSLDLTQAQERNIRRTYREYADQKREALRAWKRNKGNGATFDALITAAEDVSNMQLADDIRDLMKTLQVETERSQQSQLGEQYGDEPDSGDEKKPKTKPHQAGQLKSDSGPRSLTEEPHIRRRKKKVTMETPPEDDEESDSNTPPPVEGNGGQNTDNECTEEVSKQKESKGSNLHMKLSTKEVNSKITNMNEPTTKHAINCFALMFIVIAIAFIFGVCAYTYITTIYQK